MFLCVFQRKLFVSQRSASAFHFFDSCYLREAQFDSCDFTGCRFVATNLHGASFSDCRFDYATFERTIVDPAIIETECPSYENLRLRFARTLRMNYQQLGDSSAVNRAMKIELEATKTHLYNAWASEKPYYREKYQGFSRLKSFNQWLLFLLNDFVWGNGESIRRLISLVFVLLICMTAFDIYSFGDPAMVKSYKDAFLRSVEVFMGVSVPPEYSKPYVAFITLVRLITVGFLLSLIIKRFNRR
jgi:hypothetical protein